MKKSRGILVLILTAIVTVFFCYTAAVGIGPTGTGAMKNIKTGLDLAGGVSITYQAKDSNPSSEDMSDTVYKLQKRVEQYSTRPDTLWQEVLTRSVQPALWFWKVQMWQMLQAVQSSSRIPAAESTW